MRLFVFFIGGQDRMTGQAVTRRQKILSERQSQAEMAGVEVGENSSLGMS